VVAGVPKPILGADFLWHFSLSVDMKHHLLSGATTHLRIQGILMHDPSPSPSVTPKEPGNPYLSLLSEFPELSQVFSLERPIQHDVTHHIRHILTHSFKLNKAGVAKVKSVGQPIFVF